MLENAIVVLMVLAAAAYLARRCFRKAGRPSCGCGCPGCGSADACPGPDAHPGPRPH